MAITPPSCLMFRPLQHAGLSPALSLAPPGQAGAGTAASAMDPDFEFLSRQGLKVIQLLREIRSAFPLAVIAKASREEENGMAVAFMKRAPVK
jgi:hypothetical protein